MYSGNHPNAYLKIEVPKIFCTIIAETGKEYVTCQHLSDKLGLIEKYWFLKKSWAKKSLKYQLYHTINGIRAIFWPIGWNFLATQETIIHRLVMIFGIWVPSGPKNGCGPTVPQWIWGLKTQPFGYPVILKSCFRFFWGQPPPLKIKFGCHHYHEKYHFSSSCELI